MAKQTIPYFDLTGQYNEVKNEWFEEIERLGLSGNFILGDAIDRFETLMADYLKVEHAVSVSSGTEAISLALKASGVGPGDSVIVPDFTFFATAEAVSLIGATPIFVDIDPIDFNIDVSRIESAIRDNTKAILPVHLFGAPANLAPIMRIAADRGIAVVEDAAQAFGARIGERFAGSIGDAGCFSFYPTKVLGAFGDGGLVATNDAWIADQLKLLRNHGVTGPNTHSIIGSTNRLDCIQAAVLSVKINSVDGKIRTRHEISEIYLEQLQGLDLTLPQQQVGTTHAYNVFTVRSRIRNTIAKVLDRHGIGYQIYYPFPIHKQLPYRHLGYSDADFPESITAADEVISLPLYPEMPKSHIHQICTVIRSAVG
ncbi:MAG: DegT/DnrJ/EryC1/StrS family aminotransferase [Acidiferrobacterales bacterium]|nr:DegT/DnrJ/EryC1/StrS family aminotransferase [Acidiferrobacterales bacterium]